MKQHNDPTLKERIRDGSAVATKITGNKNGAPSNFFSPRRHSTQRIEQENLFPYGYCTTDTLLCKGGEKYCQRSI